jgi:phosphatidylglycerophosphate synthase
VGEAGVTAPTLAEVRAVGQKGAAEQYTLGRLYGSRFSAYFTYVLARTPLSANAVTAIGIGLGLVAGVLLWLPLSPIHLVSALLYQISYILDFSDGELARLRRESSQAGSYLDWLGHFYVPTLGAGMLGIQVATGSGQPVWLVLGLAATIGLAGFHFSCKEHIVIAYLRRHPEHAMEPEVQNAMLHRPVPTPGSGVPAGGPAVTHRAIQFVGSLLVYPGAMHLVSATLIADFLLGALTGQGSLAARQLLLVAWTVAFAAHAVMAVRRNFRALKSLDRLTAGREATRALRGGPDAAA